tara:strand:+ start:2338 stop:2859 length:522 start_codon:yes stop_codon:yes gene_type:complete
MTGIELSLGFTYILSAIISILGFNSIRECRQKKQLTKEINNLQTENSTLLKNIDRLKCLQIDLETSTSNLKNDIGDLQDILKITEGNTENMLTLYSQYKNTVNLDVQTKALGLLMDLDTNNDFKFDEVERRNAINKLKLLFNQQNINISDNDFDNINTLKTRLVILIENHGCS